MAAAAADLAERTAVAPAAASAAPGRPGADTVPDCVRANARQARTSAGTWILRIAAVVAIVALGGWNLLLQGQLNATQAYEQSVAAVLDVAAQPGR